MGKENSENYTSPEPLDLIRFGAALKNLRQRRGISQKEVAARILDYYREDRSYRRVENGERRPERDAVVAILVRAFHEKQTEVVTKFLELAGYEGLSETEIAKNNLEGPSLSEPSSPPLPEPLPIKAALEPVEKESHLIEAKPTLIEENPQTNEDKIQQREMNVNPGPIRPPGLVRSNLVIALFGIIGMIILANTAGELPVWLTISTTMLYAILYAVSILLETAYTDDPATAVPTALRVFGFMTLTSATALAVDSVLVSSDRQEAILVPLAVFGLSAAGQWYIARDILPQQAIVKADFQPHTARAAHLKNTSYFLLAVVLFWLPSAHAILVMQHQQRLGDYKAVGHLIAQISSFYPGIWPPKIAWLWISFVALIGATVLMRSQLLDRLQKHDSQDRYVTLFYVRAIVYFCLVLVCIVWYSTSVERLSQFSALP